MAQKILAEDGVTEVEVYTAAEMQAQIDAKVSEKEAEYKPKVEALETELGTAKTALGERTQEFGNFRKLHKDVVDKLGAAERVIYENQLAAAEAQTKREADEKTAHDATVETAIKAKAGTDEKLFGKMKEVWKVINIDARTPEQIEQKLGMVLGAIQQTEPDLIASVQSSLGGSALPPGFKNDSDKKFGETDRGKQGAAELGLSIEAPKS